MLPVARLLIIIGLVILLAGGVLYLVAQTGWINRIPLGRLPGDIRIQTGNTTCVFPIVTSILLSIVLTILLNVIVRFLNK